MSDFSILCKFVAPVVAVTEGAGHACASLLSRHEEAAGIPRKVVEFVGFPGTGAQVVLSRVGKVLAHTAPFLGHITINKAADLLACALAPSAIPASQLDYLRHRLPGDAWPADCPDGSGGPHRQFPDCPSIYVAETSDRYAAGMAAGMWFVCVSAVIVGLSQIALHRADRIARWERVAQGAARSPMREGLSRWSGYIFLYNGLVALAAAHVAGRAQFSDASSEVFSDEEQGTPTPTDVSQPDVSAPLLPVAEDLPA